MSRWPLFGVLGLVIASLLFAPVFPVEAGGEHGNPNPGVAPINSKPNGKSYAEWSEAWWQYVFSIPAACADPKNPGCDPLSSLPQGYPNPGYDETGEQCDIRQSGPVFFLVGIFNVSGAATRHCTVPPGKKLFFPILNVEANTHEYPEELGTNRMQTIANLTNLVKTFLALVEEDTLKASVDGVTLKKLPSYKVISDPFTIKLPKSPNDLLTVLKFPNPPRRINPVVSGGYWLMLEPLPPGEHIIKFGGTFGDPVNFTVNLKYHLKVKPDSGH